MRKEVIGLLDVDSAIPNLALMKLSAHHKARGADVEWYSPLWRKKYSQVYASKVFDFSDGSDIDPNEMVIGGTGWDMGVNLDPEIERLTPDYSMYNYPHSIGFAMRGCRLNCSFCVVPQKEGKPYSNNSIGEIWTQRDSDFLMLLDNDFFGNPNWQSCIDEILEYNLRVNFSQGINIRNLTEAQAAALASVKYHSISGKSKMIHFAWDDARHEKLIRRGIKRAMDAGIKPRYMTFYVLIGYNSTPEADLHRVDVLRGYGCNPFIMPYDKSNSYQKSFARWVNHKAIFKSVAWREYKSGIYETIDKSQRGLFA